MASELPHESTRAPVHADCTEDPIFNSSNPLLMRQLELVCRSDGLNGKMADWYVFVRDAIRYDPFAIELEPESLSASRTLENQRGHCIHKSILFITGLRALGVPARLGLARVRNHIATESLERILGTDVLVPHGYAAHWNGRRWVKSTPVFNRELCNRLGTTPLDWSPDEDSLFQPLDDEGGRFMEYLEDFGLHTAVPLEFLKTLLRREYPHCFDAEGQWCLPED